MKYASRKELHTRIRTALQEKSGLAAAKLGYSEQAWIKFPELYRTSESALMKSALQSWIKVHAYRQSGVFPATPEFIMAFCEKFKSQVEEVDFLAIAKGWSHLDLRSETKSSKYLEFLSLEPDRSLPYEEGNCYLPFLKGKRIVIINSISDLLVERANKRKFEAIWANINLPWFYPSEVISLTFPFIYDESTQTDYRDVWGIYDLIIKKLDKVDFDVALIGAGCLGIPIATHIKCRGKVAISLGGHLQVLFGVYGKRWERDQTWSNSYFNDAWIKSPESRTPKNKTGLPDNASYW